MSIVTRFPPSPTGMLHIGGARTALFSWLYARRHGGRFILRIEDTDLERSTPEAVQVILEGMAWLGLTWDEGPYFQSQRFDRYREVVAGLIASGHAYHCYCSRETLEAMREAQMARKEKPRYDGRCRDLSAPPPGAPAPVVRLRNPTEGRVVVRDAIHGGVVFENAELDDLIIARSDGTPTYNLCVVVDDIDMGVTHVIRGDDHLNNTPRQMNILAALGAPAPVYAHVPMILGPDGRKLSKRHGAVSVLEYREAGYLPEALLNYLVRLGWSHGDQEVFSLTEMIEAFDLDALSKSAAAVNPDKLLWLNQHYIKTSPIERLLAPFAEQLQALGIDPAGGPPLAGIIECQRERAKTLKEMAVASRFFFEAPAAFEEKAAAKNLTAEARPVLSALSEALQALPEWTAGAVHTVVEAQASAFGVGLGKVAQPLRVAVSGGGVSPPIDATLALLGPERTLPRIERALDFIRVQGTAAG
jgi:glutamyl-tRNA synthetase